MLFSAMRKLCGSPQRVA